MAAGLAAADFAAAFASRCALVVRLILTFFMPEVRLSISEAWDVDVDVSVVGRTALLDLDGGFTEASVLVESPPSFRGDLRRTREVLASGRG